DRDALALGEAERQESLGDRHDLVAERTGRHRTPRAGDVRLHLDERAVTGLRDTLREQVGDRGVARDVVEVGGDRLCQSHRQAFGFRASGSPSSERTTTMPPWTSTEPSPSDASRSVSSPVTRPAPRMSPTACSTAASDAAGT